MWALVALLFITACFNTANQTSLGYPSEVTDGVIQTTQPLSDGIVIQALDGNTIEVESNGSLHVVRYLGVAPPDARYAQDALKYNVFQVEGKNIELSIDIGGIDWDGALLRYVFIDGEMANMNVLSAGWGEVDLSLGGFDQLEAFLEAESLARSNGRGIWGVVKTTQKDFPTAIAGKTPEKNFTGGTLPMRGTFSEDMSRTCDFSDSMEPVIKGNVENATGERYYHVPGGLFYSTINIESRNGDIWFCTEHEAQVLGWRRSKR